MVNTNYSFVFLVLLFGIISFDLYGQREVINKLPRISVKENSFMKPDGTEIVFRGVKASDLDKLESEGELNSRYFNEMKNWGATIVRFPVHLLS